MGLFFLFSFHLGKVILPKSCQNPRGGWVWGEEAAAQEASSLPDLPQWEHGLQLGARQAHLEKQWRAPLRPPAEWPGRPPAGLSPAGKKESPVHSIQQRSIQAEASWPLWCSHKTRLFFSRKQNKTFHREVTGAWLGGKERSICCCCFPCNTGKWKAFGKRPVLDRRAGEPCSCLEDAHMCIPLWPEAVPSFHVSWRGSAALMG